MPYLKFPEESAFSLRFIYFRGRKPERVCAQSRPCTWECSCGGGAEIEPMGNNRLDFCGALCQTPRSQPELKSTVSLNPLNPQSPPVEEILDQPEGTEFLRVLNLLKKVESLRFHSSFFI